MLAWMRKAICWLLAMDIPIDMRTILDMRAILEMMEWSLKHFSLVNQYNIQPVGSQRLYCMQLVVFGEVWVDLVDMQPIVASLA